MVKSGALALLICVGFAQPLQAQPRPATSSGAAAQPVTIESYYRIRWGSAAEFKRLYERNHAPVLREMQRLGFITAIRMEEPFTHMAGGPRWDLRVSITFRDAEAAVVSGGEFDRVFGATEARLFPNRAVYASEEAQRFALLEDHWDIIIKDAQPQP